MQVIDLFSGIGGFSYAASLLGWETIQFCEIDSYCQQVLRKNFAGVPIHNNIKTLKGEQIKTDPNKPVIIVGGFPCQPFSVAGKRKGTEDDRHLWPEMLRIIREVRPDWVVGENVSGLFSWDGGLVFEQVCTDLEAIGYKVFPSGIPAASIGAPHKRERIWFIATNTTCWRGRRGGNINSQEGGESSNKAQFTGGNADATYTNSGGLEGASALSRVAKYAKWQGRVMGKATTFTYPAYYGLQTQGPKIETARIEQYRKLGNWFCSYTNLQRCKECYFVKFPNRKGQYTWLYPTPIANQYWEGFPTQQPTVTTKIKPGLRRRNDGVSNRMDKALKPKKDYRVDRLKALGNAIVPQIALRIFKAIAATQAEIENKF